MGKCVFFASDFHLGLGHDQDRERRIISWLDHIKDKALAIYLVGDLFDFWYEYKHVAPKGYVRFLGKLAEIADSGIELHVFTGNHDLWMKSYLSEEIGFQLYREPIAVDYFGQSLLVGHGDGLGPGDHGYKFMKRFFESRICQWLFTRLHPNFSFGLANYFSKLSRRHTEESTFLGPDKEWLIQYCEELITNDQVYDYYIFGHRHLPIDHVLSNQKSRYINLGDWIQYDTYAVLCPDGELEFLEFRPSD